MVIKKNYLFTARINLGLELGGEKEDDAYVEFREPNTIELMEIQDAYQRGNTEIVKHFLGALPAMVIDHNLFDEQAKLSADAAIRVIFDKPAAAMKLIGEFAEKVISPFPSPKDKKSPA